INSSVAINIVEVEIDSETYRIYPKKYWGYYDIGTPLDRKVVMGQIQGGVLQGIAHSHMERIEFNIVGGIVQKNMTDYLIPTGRDMLEMEIYLADNPGNQGPLGAKALGELPFIGMTSALLAGVNSALSTKISKIPLYPEMLLEVKDEFKI
ncbi:MAG: molybdopterin cofactor-binding domain-containing protein, partial [Fusobacteriaceae bacterium]